jgi:GxxExxY protein
MDLKFNKEQTNKIVGTILDSAIAVHREMGPGLLESVYQVCLKQELNNRGLLINSNVPVQLCYKGTRLNKEYVIDILVENSIIIELKACDDLAPVHQAQLISYLQLADLPVGLLINFNVPVLKDGFKRLLNKKYFPLVKN